MPDLDDVIVPHETQIKAAQLGGRPALIESFGIRGLYGYRTISLSSHHAATILIARNGTGKTTLLGALDAFLRMQFYRLRELDFQEIFCRLRGMPQELLLTHEDLIEYLKVSKNTDLARFAARVNVDTDKLFNFFTSDFNEAFDRYYDEYTSGVSIVNSIVRGFPDLRTAKKAANIVYDSMFEASKNLSSLKAGLSAALREHEIVYLPTYRRVELSLTDQGEENRHRRRPRPKVKIYASGLHTPNIEFGLSDISERLSELNSDIIVKSNRGYRELSENIINELIRGYEVSEDTTLPSPDDLKLFFSRLESGNRMIGPYYPISTPDFDKIYSGEGVPAESRKFLTYFLGKLNGIILITKAIEQPVGEFIASCNKYLSSFEPSTALLQRAKHQHLPANDAKLLKVNRTDLSVSVESIPARSPISLDALSSGEKQMVSLLAKMYLYPRKKIVLIDEPELSLSIDWQRGILVDVLLSPHCEQVIAITHSPFIFDNTLEPFARTLDLEISQRPDPELDFRDRSVYDDEDISD